MKLDFATYKDKLTGCWAGKNIGGVLGAPFEGIRAIHDIDFYVQEDLEHNPVPNDDLDLQLVWMNAVERYGRGVNARILGDYWLSFIIPDWVEYGAGQNNMRMGIAPPLSGALGNVYKDSCGCFIRSELWACLAPGRPELAARYAYEDGCVDHASEGLYGEIFCAAMQSAAFVESDTQRLIEIGLSYIPADCAVTRAVKAAIAAFQAGKTWQEARIDVLCAAPGTFGVQSSRLSDIDTRQIPAGAPGFDAPGNIGITILAWLYGGGDFGKSLCIAVNCGEDTDCTAATLGALLGILLGGAALPAEWLRPLDDKISTVCINKVNGGLSIPATVTELTDRLLRLTPFFLGRELCDLLAPGGYTIDCLEGDALFCTKDPLYIPGINGSGKPKLPTIPQLLEESPHALRYTFPGFHALLDYGEDPYIRAGEPKTLKLVLHDSGEFGCLQQWAAVRWYLPEGVTVSPAPTAACFLAWQYLEKNELAFTFTLEALSAPKVELVCDISLNGRHTHGLIKATLLAAP